MRRPLLGLTALCVAVSTYTTAQDFGHTTNKDGANKIGSQFVMNYIDQDGDHAMATISNIGSPITMNGITLDTPDPVWSVKNGHHKEWFRLERGGNPDALEVIGDDNQKWFLEVHSQYSASDKKFAVWVIVKPGPGNNGREADQPQIRIKGWTTGTPGWDKTIWSLSIKHAGPNMQLLLGKCPGKNCNTVYSRP